MTDPYQKILGVIKEIGIDLRLAIDNQGNSNSLKTSIKIHKTSLMISQYLVHMNTSFKKFSNIYFDYSGNGFL